MIIEKLAICNRGNQKQKMKGDRIEKRKKKKPWIENVEKRQKGDNEMMKNSVLVFIELL